MTTELVILLSFTLLIMLALVDSIPGSFESSAPFLSARIERQLETGLGFAESPSMKWIRPK